jgi:hypothetical protein
MSVAVPSSAVNHSSESNVNFRALRIGTLKRYARYYNISLPEDTSALEYANAVAA